MLEHEFVDQAVVPAAAQPCGAGPESALLGVSAGAPAASRLGTLGASGRAGVALGLQRSSGNQAVQRVARSGATRGVRVTPGRRSAVSRSPASDLREMADAGGQMAQDAQRDGTDQPPAMGVSNVHDVNAARELSDKIQGFRSNMEAGASADGAFTVSPLRVTPAKMAANETAIAVLDDYLVTAGEQSRTLGGFQDGLSKSRIDYERLKAQVTHMTVSGAISGEGTGGDVGNQIVQAAGFADSDSAGAKMNEKLVANVGLQAVRNQVQDAHDQMTTAGQAVGGKQEAVSTAAYSYSEALNNFQNGIPVVTDNPEAAKALADVKEKIEKVKKYVAKGLEYAGKGAEKLGVKGAEKAGEIAAKGVDFLTDEYFNAELNGVQAKVTEFNTSYKEHAISAKLDGVRAASHTFTSAVTAHQESVEAFAHAQQTFRDKLNLFGRSADGGHGDHYAQVAAVLAEVDTYENQLDTTLRLGYQEQAAGRQAASARKTAEGSKTTDTDKQAATVYYEPDKTFHANGGWGYQCYKQEIYLHSLPSTRGSAEGVTNLGVNATVDDGIAALKVFRDDIEPMRQALSSAMGLSMGSGAPTSAGGAAPTARSSNTAH